MCQAELRQCPLRAFPWIHWSIHTTNLYSYAVSSAYPHLTHSGHWPSFPSISPPRQILLTPPDALLPLSWSSLHPVALPLVGLLNPGVVQSSLTLSLTTFTSGTLTHPFPTFTTLPQCDLAGYWRWLYPNTISHDRWHFYFSESPIKMTSWSWTGVHLPTWHMIASINRLVKLTRTDSHALYTKGMSNTKSRTGIF